jgi:hypothetical protein
MPVDRLYGLVDGLLEVAAPGMVLRFAHGQVRVHMVEQWRWPSR